MTETLIREETEVQADGSEWMPVARGAAITMVVWAVLLTVIAREIIPPVLIVGAIYVVFSRFLEGTSKRLAATFVIVSILAVVGNLPFIVSSMSHPSSAPSFILTHLSLVAAVVGVVGGLGVIRRWESDFRGIFIGFAAVLFVAGLGVAGLSAAGVESVPAQAGDVEVVARGIVFEQETITLAAGETGIWLDNRDGTAHTFTIEELGVDVDMVGLKSTRIDVSAAPGTYEVICAIPGHESMTATLIVEG